MINIYNTKSMSVTAVCQVPYIVYSNCIQIMTTFRCLHVPVLNKIYCNRKTDFSN